jgi:hypothetical protein
MSTKAFAGFCRRVISPAPWPSSKAKNLDPGIFQTKRGAADRMMLYVHLQVSYASTGLIDPYQPI